MQAWYDADWYNPQLTDWLLTLEQYSEPIRTSEMELSAKILKDWKPLTVFTKSTILYVQLGYASGLTTCNSKTDWMGVLILQNTELTSSHYTNTQLLGCILESLTYQNSSSKQFWCYIGYFEQIMISYNWELND